jgi:hypothetical protein
MHTRASPHGGGGRAGRGGDQWRCGDVEPVGRGCDNLRGPGFTRAELRLRSGLTGLFHAQFPRRNRSPPPPLSHLRSSFQLGMRVHADPLHTRGGRAATPRTMRSRHSLALGPFVLRHRAPMCRFGGVVTNTARHVSGVRHCCPRVSCQRQPRSAGQHQLGQVFLGKCGREGAVDSGPRPTVKAPRHIFIRRMQRCDVDSREEQERRAPL